MTRTEMTEGMRVWTSPRPEGNVMKIRVTSAWMSCTSPLRRPGKGGRLKMRTASKRYRRSIRFFFSTNIYWVVIKEYFYFRLHFPQTKQERKILNACQFKKKKKGKVLFSFRKKIEMESETFKWRKMTGISEPSQSIICRRDRRWLSRKRKHCHKIHWNGYSLKVKQLAVKITRCKSEPSMKRM